MVRDYLFDLQTGQAATVWLDRAISRRFSYAADRTLHSLAELLEDS